MFTQLPSNSDILSANLTAWHTAQMYSCCYSASSSSSILNPFLKLNCNSLIGAETSRWVPQVSHCLLKGNNLKHDLLTATSVSLAVSVNQLLLTDKTRTPAICCTWYMRNSPVSHRAQPTRSPEEITLTATLQVVTSFSLKSIHIIKGLGTQSIAMSTFQSALYSL